MMRYIEHKQTLFYMKTLFIYFDVFIYGFICKYVEIFLYGIKLFGIFVRDFFYFDLSPQTLSKVFPLCYSLFLLTYLIPPLQTT